MSRHGVEIHSTGRFGHRAVCICGWRSGAWSTAGGASYAFAEHLRDQPETTEETP